MTHFKIIIAVIFFMLPLGIMAQFKPVWSLSINVGYGKYDMADLKKVNDITKSNLPFHVNDINDFEPDFYYGMSLHVNIQKGISLGIVYQYFTTGSRIGQKDYSGYYAYDQIINGHFMGIEPGLIIIKKNFVVSPSICTGVLLSRLEMNEEFIVGGTENHEAQNLVAHSIIVIPVVKISKPVFGPLSCFLSLGNMFDIGGRLHLPGKKDAILAIGGSEIKTGWSGWRISLGLNLKIFNKNPTPREYRGSDYFQR